MKSTAWLDNILDLLTNEELPTFKNEKEWTWGCCQQRERLLAIAESCILTWEGDLVEIGCYTAGSTKKLAELARKHNRRVIAIDPWGTETQGTEKEYAIFLRTMKPYLDITDIVRLPSQDVAAKAVLKERELCFAMVDGEHSYKATLSDILAVSHAPVIFVDDVLWHGGIERALQEGAQITNKRIVRHKLCREAYLLRK